MIQCFGRVGIPFKPLSRTSGNHKVDNILVGAVYVSPRTRHKAQTIDHVIEAIHLARSKFGNDLHILIGGFFNRLDVSPILHFYGALIQIVSIPTGKRASLASLFPSFPTLDGDKTGSDSDYDVVIVAPNQSSQYAVEWTKIQLVMK